MVQRWRTWAREHRASFIGIIGAVLLLSASCLHLALSIRFYMWDEPSHVGYSLSIRSGEIPTIDTPVPSDPRSPVLDTILEQAEREIYPRDIYTANNPPFVYTLAVPATELATVLGLPGRPLAGLRMVGVVSVAVAVAFGYLLGWEVARDRTVALATAGLLAASPGIAVVSAVAGMDGPALAATTAVAWALTRVVRRRTAHDARILGVACAVAAAVRPMSLAYALAAGLIGVIVLTVSLDAWRDRLMMAVRVALPTLVATGWYYLLNLIRYGDPTASKALFEKFHMEGSDTSMWDFVFSSGSLIEPLGVIVLDGYPGSWFFPSSGAQAAGAVLALTPLVAAVIAVRAAHGHSRERVGRTALVWGSLIALSCVPVLLLAMHTTGGGTPHPRYVFPVLPVVASAVAVIARSVHRMAPVLLVTMATAWSVFEVASKGYRRYTTALTPGWVSTPGTIGGPGMRAASLVLAGIGGVMLIYGLVRLVAFRDTAHVGSANDAGPDEPTPTSP